MSKDFVYIRRWVATVAVLAAIAGGVLLAKGWGEWTGRSVFGAPGSPVTLVRDAAPVNLGNFSNGFASVLKPALPAVVNINTSKVVKQDRNSANPMFNDPFFRQFFGDQLGQGQPHPQRERSLGSGVIITSDGTILTNNHVIDGASDIRVTLSDKREFQAKVIGADPKTDIAILKIAATDLPTLPLGDSSQLRVGDIVFAIGEPFGLGGTATMGIVSATGRGMERQIEDYEDFIQTDASINPGNSGGAMIDLHGNLVGINTAILAGEGGGSQGIGFAIPIAMAKNVMDQILTHGKVVRGYLGLALQDITPEIAKQFGLKQLGGALVGDVSPDTPASRAGFKRGDVILELNGQSVGSANELRLHISQTAPGTPVKLEISRDGKTQDLTVTLAEFPEKEAKASPGENSGAAAVNGIEVQDLTPDIAKELQLTPGTRGVVVSSVDESSPAAEKLQRGDVIQEVNHKPVSSVQEYRQAMAGAGSQPALLLVNRGGLTQYVVVEPSAK